MASTVGSQSQHHSSGAPKLILAKRIAPLPSSLPSPTTPAATTASRRQSSSSISSSSSLSSSTTSLSWRNRSSVPPNSSPSTSPPIVHSAWATTNNWRSGSPPKSPSKPAFNQLQEGQVLYLGDIPTDSSFWQHPQLSTPQHHPVVVLGKWRGFDGEAYVHFRVITSFGGERLQDKKPQHQWHYFMLCENTQEQAEPSEVRFARTVPGFGVFPKRCYVNLSANSAWQIEYKDLEVFSPQPSLLFDSKSTAEMKRATAFY